VSRIAFAATQPTVLVVVELRDELHLTAAAAEPSELRGKGDAARALHGPIELRMPG
jgi:hypothetical protein